MSDSQIVLLCLGVSVVLLLIILVLRLRRIVPSNTAHILQRSKSTVSYKAERQAVPAIRCFPKNQTVGLIVKP
jgi:hypothetical protein